MNNLAEFYNKNPYPRPEKDWDTPKFELGMPCMFFHDYWPNREKTEDLDILVAGCGTNQAVRWAINHPNARVTGFDISEVSVGIARKAANKLGLKNLTLDCHIISDVDVYDNFDIIVATGVIHHMESPGEALRALAGQIKDDGRILLMVYGKWARECLNPAKEYLRLIGHTGNSDPKVVREDLRELPAYNPFWRGVEQFEDLARCFGKLQDPSDDPDSYLPQMMDYMLHPCEQFHTFWDLLRLCYPADLDLVTVYNRSNYAMVKGVATDKAEAMRGVIPSHTVVLGKNNLTAQAQLIWEDKCIPWKYPKIVARRIGSGGKVRLSSRFNQFSDSFAQVTKNEFEMVQNIDGEKDRATLCNQYGVENNNALWSDLYNHDIIGFRVKGK